ncbi:MAG: hypothetical protein ABW250_18115 [Pyrinomonadaceae bacterium]
MVNSSKKNAADSATALTVRGVGLDLGRTGMPAPDSIVEVRTLQPPAPEASSTRSASRSAAAPRAFRIIRTNEVDGYEQAANAQETLATRGATGRAAKKSSKKTAAKASKKAADKDTFGGTARKAAKLSLSAAPVKAYKDVRTLVNTLPSHDSMAALKIPKGAGSGRVAQEERNVRVKTFLYAASREDDNDFHLILGRSPEASPEVYMTMELSGLPAKNAPSFAKLKAARDAYKAFFGSELPGTSYDFYDPPIPVTIEGSLFWDASHATGTRPGPQSLKSRMPVVWEVHPISKIDFNP